MHKPCDVSSLHDANGHVQVPGFYDDVVELTDDERALFAKVPVDDAEFLKFAQSRALQGEAGFSTLERVGARPTAEVNGIGGGYQGDGGKTIVPSDAFVKLSFRLVADQDPRKIIAGVDELIRAKPSAAKGRYIRSVTFATTMGPGVKVDPARTRDIVEEPVAA